MRSFEVRHPTPAPGQVSCGLLASQPAASAALSQLPCTLRAATNRPGLLASGETCSRSLEAPGLWVTLLVLERLEMARVTFSLFS